MEYLETVTDNFVLSWDLGIVAFLFFAAFFYGFSAGSRKLGALLASIYFSFALLNLAPYINPFVSEMPDYRVAIFKIGLFTFLTFSVFSLVAGSLLRSSLGLPKKEDSQLWHFLLLGVASAGLFISSALAFTPESFYDKLSTITRQGFLENNAHFWWAVSGIVTFMILRKTKKQ